jgi:hypothetical protein
MAMDRDGSASGSMHPHKITGAPRFPGPLARPFARHHHYRHRWWSHGRWHYTY